jgi:nucleoside-diphosphate-sugar epimerase
VKNRCTNHVLLQVEGTIPQAEDPLALHVIVGSGAVGSATAQHLLDAGHQVRVVTRHSTGVDHPHVERVAADATDADRMTALVTGAASLYNCASPRYHRWPIDWPPIAHALLTSAERTGAGLVTMSNLYGYGPVNHPMTEDLPLAAGTVKGRVRAQMWQEALAAHEAGRARVTEARGSDFVGANFDRAFVVDSTAAQETFGLRPTSLDDALRTLC